VLALVFGCFVLGSLFWGVSWASLILVFGFLSGRPRSGRQWLVLATSRELWGQVFKIISGRGSVREVEHILLSERNGGGSGSKGIMNQFSLS
jgi:hypothetical protein